MSRQAKEAHGLQVFPFLAVLVCTMGALIFLLLVTTSQIRRRPSESTGAPGIQDIASNDDSASLKPPERGFPEPDVKTDSATIVIPPQPPRDTPAKSKPIKVPDQSYALALAQREREIADLTTKWKIRTNILAKERKRHEAALKEHKSLFDAAVEQADLLKTEVAKLEGQLEQLDREATTAAADNKDDIERQKVEKQIAEMKRRLLAAQAAEASAENEKFQVIPFDVQTGTTRRPIFIECTATGIRIQPENILITAADLEGFPANINPLAAGTGALINYWMDQNRKQRGAKSAAEPYILLLVRPDGVIAYYVALRMLEPIRTSHGYELVDDSMKLQFPEVDPGARAACQNAIDYIMSERESITRTAVAFGGSASVYGGKLRSRAGSGGSGLGAAPGSDDGSGSGNSGPGSGGKPGDQGFSMSEVTGENKQVGTRSWERVENFLGERPQRRRASGTASGSNTGSGSPGGSGNGANQFASGNGAGGTPSSSRSRASGTTYSGSSADGPVGTSRGSSNGRGSTTGAASQGGPATGGAPIGRAAGGKSMFGDDDDSAPEVSQLSQNRSNGSSGATASGSSSGEPSVFGLNGAVADTGAVGSTANPSGLPGGSRGQQRIGTADTGSNQTEFRQSLNGQGMSGVQGSSQPGGMTGQGGSPMTSGGNAGPGGNRRGGSSDSSDGGGTFAGNGSDSAPPFEQQNPNVPMGERPGKKKKNANQSGGDDLAGPGEGSAGDGTSGDSAGSGSASGRGGRGQRSTLSDNSAGPARDPNGNRPSASSTQSKRKPSSEPSDRELEPEMLVGRRWGYCEQGATIGLEREVRVDVTPDKLMIAERYQVAAGNAASRQETFETFATALDRHSREWGRPPQGFHWTPRLRFIVKPEAYGQYEQINSMMTRAGLPTSHELAKTAEKIEYGRDETGPTKPAVKAATKTTTGGAR